MIHDDKVNFKKNTQIDGYIKIDDWWYLVVDETTAEKTTEITNFLCELNYIVILIKATLLNSLSRAIKKATKLLGALPWAKK